VKVTVNVTRRPEIADPQGATVHRALADLGYGSVRSVRVDRTLHLDVDGEEPEAVRAEVARMCEQLIANPVLEDFEVVVQP
jgi:phosphoribosylformylglycinamidine synthase subunit PurS